MTMDKQGSVRPPRGLSVAASLGFSGSHRGDSSLSTAAAEETASPDGTSPQPHAGSRFDLLESLGPSLLEVLTYVNPPQPLAHRTQQEAGEDPSGDTSSSNNNNGPLGTEEDPAAGAEAATAKFDTCLTRSAILGRLVDPTVDNTRKLQEFFARALERLKCEATGLVLLLESTVVVFLETTSEQFCELCRLLMGAEQAVMDAKSLTVLGSCDDNAVRLLQGLFFRKISITRTADAAEWNDDGLRQLVVDTFLNLLKFIRRIGPMPPAEIRKILTNLSNSDQAFLPSNELLLWLLARDDIMTVGDFLELYDSPITIELESERVWPVHPLLHY